MDDLWLFLALIVAAVVIGLAVIGAVLVNDRNITNSADPIATACAVRGGSVCQLVPARQAR